MNADQILHAIEYYRLTVFAPPASKVAEGREWHARDASGNRQGFGSTPAEAIEAAAYQDHDGFLCAGCGEDQCTCGAKTYTPNGETNFPNPEPTNEWDFLE